MQTQPSTAPAPPPKQALYWQQAILWQTLGFLIVVVLTWSDVVFDLAHVILGMPHREMDVDRAAIITVVIVLLWIISAYKIYLITARLSYLESFLHVCSWCRRIEQDGHWLSLEEHFTRKTGGQVKHGVCPECARKVMEDLPGVIRSVGRSV